VADTFVLSSKYEGLPTVLIEALACGIQIVSTDCPSGPGEILAQGEFGELVPVGDDEAMANAIEATFDNPRNLQAFMKRADDFSANQAGENYKKVLSKVLKK
jgi:glycosyltransferase involved in cell wall biosynthesis